MTVVFKCKCGNEREVDFDKPVINADDEKIDVWTDYDPRIHVSCKCGEHFSI